MKCCVNSFFDQDNFLAMKTLSGCEAVRCDENEFIAKIKVSTWSVFELSLFEKWSEPVAAEDTSGYCWFHLASNEHEREA